MAIVLATPAASSSTGWSKLRGFFLPGALVVVLVFGVAIALAASGGGEASRPQISGWFERKAATLTVKVAASDLPSDRLLTVKVDLQTIRYGSGIDDPRPWGSRGSLPQERAYIGGDADGDVRHEFKVPILIDGPYTHIVIEATTGDNDEPCIELPAPETPDDKTACMFIPLLEP